MTGGGGLYACGADGNNEIADVGAGGGTGPGIYACGAGGSD
jgi:hypothetical protein